MLFIDTDCISAFLWINNEPLVPKIFPNTIVSNFVYEEIEKIPWKQERIDKLAKRNLIKIFDLQTTPLNPSEAAELLDLYNAIVKKYKFGSGEASCIALSYIYSGIVGSNNFKDIMHAKVDMKFPYITSGDILIIAVHRKLITRAEAESMWQQMLSKRRKLGANSFEEYYDITRKSKHFEEIKQYF